MKRLFLSMIVLLALSACDFNQPVVETRLLPGHDIIAIGETYVDPGCMISIDEIEYKMETNDTIDSSTPNETTITYAYQYQDTEYYCYRVVKVMDRTSPEMTLQPGIDTVQIGSQHIDAGVTVSDNITEELDVTIINNVNTTEVGTYTIVYTTTDEAGNTTTMTRYVTVFDPSLIN